MSCNHALRKRLPRITQVSAQMHASGTPLPDQRPPPSAPPLSCSQRATPLPIQRPEAAPLDVTAVVRLTRACRNWRGPMWVNANALACYGLAQYGYTDLAIDIATRVVGALAADLRTSHQWHEAYSTDDGSALAAPGFLSWDTLSAELLDNLRRGVNPFKLAPRAAA